MTGRTEMKEGLKPLALDRDTEDMKPVDRVRLRANLSGLEETPFKEGDIEEKAPQYMYKEWPLGKGKGSQGNG